MKSAVVFKDFSFAYQGRVQALTNINLDIPDGSFTAVAGLNGAGKTSLCFAVSGLVPHYFGGAVAGTVTVAGVNTLSTEVSAIAEQVGAVLEDYECQLVTMSVEEEVAFSLENRGIEPQKIRPVVSETLEMVGLAGLEKREVASLSGGQKQRLAIAAAIAASPSILVLDEPASALDPEGAEELYALLGRLNRETGMTIMVVEHDLARVLPYADRMVVMDGGKVAAAGEIAAVLEQITTQFRCPELAPSLWTLKELLEAKTGEEFTAWRRDEDAALEIGDYLASRGVSKSA